ncbi:MAG: hypothetical protein U0103_12010 [Candidatus Obscuribacterales bacterium]
MGKTSELFADADLVRRAGRRGIAESISLHAFSGAVGGATNAELEALTHGKAAPDLDTFLNRTKQYAAFGAVFGIADATINRAHVRLAKADNELGRTNAQTSEDFIRNHVNESTPMRSPMLTWLAENRPELRPPNYEAYKADIVTKATLDRPHLGLIDWPVEQRPQVLAEVRKIASRTQLSSDANIDAFISRLDVPEFRDYASAPRVEARSQAYSAWSSASERLQNFIAADPALNEMSIAKIVTSPEVQKAHPKLGPLIEEVSTAEKAYGDMVRDHLAQTNIEAALGKTVNSIADDAGLPQINRVRVLRNDSADGTYNSDGRILALTTESCARGSLQRRQRRLFTNSFITTTGLVSCRSCLDAHLRKAAIQLELKFASTQNYAKLNQPGATLDLLQRLGDETSMTSRMLSPLPKNIAYYAEEARAGRINTATWHETEINTELSELLVSRLINARKVAWRTHTSYVGTLLNYRLVCGLLD